MMFNGKKKNNNFVNNALDFINSDQARQMFGSMSAGAPFGQAYADSANWDLNRQMIEREQAMREMDFNNNLEDRAYNNALTMARINQISQPPAMPEQYEDVHGPNGNMIGQRNLTTNKFSSLPATKVPQDKTFDHEKDLRGEFRTMSKTFEETQRNFINMQENAADKTGASDVALVFSFFKTIDPTSTVREGEFATAASAAGLPQQLIAAFARLDSGEFLPDQLRVGLVDVAGRAYQQRVIDQQNLEERYNDLSQNYNLSPENVVRPGGLVRQDTLQSLKTKYGLK